MDETGAVSILDQIDAVITASPIAARAVMLPPDRWSALCQQTGLDPDAVLMQHRIAGDQGEQRVFIMPQGPIA
jgi:hypothetical protein